MNKILIFTAILIFNLVFGSVQPSCAQTSKNKTQSEKGWLGEYEFFDSEKFVRKNSPTANITYKITIYESNNTLRAKFEASGAQTDDNYECTVKISGSGLNLYFSKDLSGGETGKFKPLKQGDLVASLVKTKVGKQAKYLFKAGDYKIDLLSARAGTPVYFKKIK
jgi:hypothetical protein